MVPGLLAFLAMLAVLIFHRYRTQQTSEGIVRSAPRVALGVGAGRAGLFWSGAMRCPKCRADMELLEIEDVQIDRCSECRGLWFHAGEEEKLRDRKIATALDVGDETTGKEHNTVDDYQCPRCGGEMLRMVDPKQRHIWFERCAGFYGSYFDAGEFADLSTRSLSDFFKRFTVGARE